MVGDATRLIMPEHERRSSPIKSVERPSASEKLFVALVLLLSTSAFMNFRVTVAGQFSSQNVGKGMVGMQVVWVLVYVVAFALYFRKCSRPARTLVTIAPFFALAALAFASASWSQDPMLSVRRSVALGLTFVFGLYFASRFNLKEQLRLLGGVFAICIVFSVLFQLLGINPVVEAPGWYGVFYLKNELGRMMVLSSIVFLFWGRVEPDRRGLARTGFWASVVLIALSRSMTSVVVFFLLMALLPYLRWTLRKSMRWMVAGTAFLLVAGTTLVMFVVTHLREVTGLLGRSPTLTGRVPLWILSFVMALRRPWLGYGFNAFWLADEPYVQKIWRLLHWEPPHAHNGYLELWLELGIVGVVLFLLIFAYYVTKAIGTLRYISGPAAAWPLTFLMFLFLANLTENALLVRNSVYLILYVAIAASLHKQPVVVRAAETLRVPQVHHA